jgi:hypothetical protein
LRDTILELGSLDQRDAIIKATGEQIKTNWHRRNMKDFEYLMVGLQPSTEWTIALFILGTLLSIGLTVYFWIEDPFDSRPLNNAWANQWRLTPKRFSSFRSSRF